MKTLLKTSYPCLVKTDSDMCELEENDTLEIEDEQFLFVYPQNGNIPFYIDTKSEIENRFVSIIKRDDNRIFLLEKDSNLHISKKETLYFAGKQCEVEISKNLISFETENQKTSLNFAHKSNDFKVFKHKSFACVWFEKDFYAYSMQKHKLFHFSGENLSFENGEIFVTKNFCDSMQREKTSRYSLDEDLNVLEENFVSQDTKKIAELLPYKVMESIKAKDYAFAINCLSENLQNQIDASKLNHFFGRISTFLPLSTTEFIALSKSGKKYINFHVSNHKIDDISVDDL